MSTIFFRTLVLGLTLILITPASAAVEVGVPAPVFVGKDSFGRTISLARYKGKIVVLEWTNHNCPFVRKHYGPSNMQSLQKEMTEQGVVWLSIISSATGKDGYLTPAEVNQLNALRGAAPTATLMDDSGEIGHLYAAKTTPHMFVIDPAGMLVYNGALDDRPSVDPADAPVAKNYVRAAVDDLKNGRAVATPVTRPYGCAVKY